MTEYLTTAEVAKELGVSVMRVRQLIQRERLAATKFGPVYMIARGDLATLIRHPTGRPRQGTQDAARNRTPAPHNGSGSVPGAVVVGTSRRLVSGVCRGNSAGHEHSEGEQTVTTTRGRMVIAVVGRKGGAGKTTTAFNVAGALLARGARVLLVDMDPQASLTGILLGERSRQGVGTAIQNPAAALAPLIVDVGAGLFLAPGDRTIERAAQDLSDSPTGFFRLRKLLAPLGGFDIIVIDTPPALGFAISSAVLAAHLAVLPTLTGQHDLDAMIDTVRLITDQQDLGGARLAAVVPCAVRPRELHDRGALLALTESFGDLVSAPVPYSPRVRESLMARQPMAVYDPSSPAALAYNALADKLSESQVPHA